MTAQQHASTAPADAVAASTAAGTQQQRQRQQLQQQQQQQQQQHSHVTGDFEVPEAWQDLNMKACGSLSADLLLKSAKWSGVCCTLLHAAATAACMPKNVPQQCTTAPACVLHHLCGSSVTTRTAEMCPTEGRKSVVRLCSQMPGPTIRCACCRWPYA